MNDGALDGLDVLPHHDGGWIDHHDDLPLNQAGAVSDPWDAIESGIFGDIGSGLDLGVCLDEEDLASAHQFGQTPNFATGGGIPKSGKGRLSIGASLVSEFEDPGQQIAYLLLHDRITGCFVESATKKKQRDSLSWVFTPDPDEHERTYRECCDVLMVRPWVLQTRVQYQFYIKSMVFNERLPTNTVRLPNLIQAEAAYFGGDEGAVLASVVWACPGIENQDLIKTKVSSRAAQLLEEKGILSESKGRWYMTGRNPLMKQYLKTSISWSSLWPSEG